MTSTINNLETAIDSQNLPSVLSVYCSATISVSENFPENKTYLSLDASDDRSMKYDSGHYFRAKDFYKENRRFLLEPENVPVPNIYDLSSGVNNIDMLNVDDDEVEKNENRKLEIDRLSKDGIFNIPAHFFQNTDNRLPEKIHNDQKISAPKELISCANPQRIIYCSIKSGVFGSDFSVIFKALDLYKSLEIMDMSGIGLTTLPPNFFPKLRIGSFCDNNIENSSSIIAFVQRHRNLSVLDFRRNPIALKERTRQVVAATAFGLKYLNGRELTIKDRIEAMSVLSKFFSSKDVENYHFFYLIKSMPEIASLKTWDPVMITHLSLPGCGLQSFRVHQFLNLMSLNLSDNSIKTLTDSGLVKCQKLVSLDLSSNKIGSQSHFDVFQYIPSLVHVWLSKNLVERYRSYIIFKCYTAKNTSLSSIDGLTISFDEINRSLEAMQSTHSLGILPMISNLFFGSELRSFDFFGRVNFRSLTNLNLICKNIDEIDLRNFVNLRYLNLRGNNIKVVKNLDMCTKIRVIDLSHNKNLDIDEFLGSVKSLYFLSHLFFAEDCWNPSFREIECLNDFFVDCSSVNSSRNKARRNRVVKLLLPLLKYLKCIDRVDITIDERIESLNLTESENSQLHDYRAMIAFFNAVKGDQRVDFTKDKILDNSQIDRTRVSPHIDLSNLSLQNCSRLEFSNFVNLKVIDLSNNKLRTISKLGLETCERLTHLDLSNNEIDERPYILGRTIDSIKQLQMIALAGNPCVSTHELKMELFSRIKRLTNEKDSLRVIDYQILPSNIIESHRLTNSLSKERLLFSFALKVRTNNADSIKILDLSNCGLSYINLTELKRLEKLSLNSNKFTSYEKIEGLNQLTRLKTIDLRKNLIESADSFLIIISFCPKLINIGIQYNPCTFDSYRESIIKRIINLRNPECSLCALDDVIITQSELSSIHGDEIDDIEKFYFELSVNRNMRKKYVLDLSHSNLSYVSFNNFTSIRLLNLSHNNLTLNDLINSSLSLCTKVEYIDLSHNLIENTNESNIGRFLSDLPRLIRLEIAGNPVCPEQEDWLSFIDDYAKITEDSCLLRIINGHEITLEERVQIVQKQTKSIAEAEAFRCKFILSQISENWINVRSLHLHGLQISNISPISLTTRLTILDLSSNKISSLKNTGFEKLVNLTSLDIHDNCFESLSELRDSLSLLPKLVNLFMVNCTFNRTETDEPDKYVGYMCNILRGLNVIDHLSNPDPLKATHLSSLKDIEQLVQWNNPNHIHDIDLSNRNIDPDTFKKLLQPLSLLQPKSLSFSGNPCVLLEQYRYLVIFNIPEIRVIDGEHVSQDQVLNASNKIRETNTQTKVENYVVAAGLFGGGYLDAEERGNLMSNISLAREYAQNIGTMISKWEIFITFQQILGIVINFFDKIDWPKIFANFQWILFPFTIDLSFLEYLTAVKLPSWYQYASFFIYIFLPAFLYVVYRWAPNKEFWHTRLTDDIKLTFIDIFVALFYLVVCSIGLAFIADANVTISTGKFTDNQYAWLTILSLCSIAITVTCLVLTIVYYKKSSDPVLWFKCMKYKKKIALFFLTILYYPICKAFINVFLCSDGHNKTFAELECLNSPSNIQLVHVFSFIFGIMYAIFIPAFFIKLINKGVKEIDLNYRIDVKFKKLEEEKKNLKKMKSDKVDKAVIKKEAKRIKEYEKEIELSYAKAALEYEKAASYLYNSYKRRKRYKKVIDMALKLVFLLFLSFFPKEVLQLILSTSLMFLVTAFTFIDAPLSSFSESVLEIFSKAAVFIIMVFGDLFHFDYVKLTSGRENIFGLLLIGLVVAVFVLFIALIVYAHTRKKKSKLSINATDCDNSISNSIVDETESGSIVPKNYTIKKLSEQEKVDDIFDSLTTLGVSTVSDEKLIEVK